MNLDLTQRRGERVLKPVRITYGTDPEGFFEKGGAIIGSEKIIPVHGIGAYNAMTVRDGIQFEVHVGANYEHQKVAVCMSNAFSDLKAVLKNIPEVSCCWRGLVEVSREELDSLSEASRILGCTPSKNIYGDRPITVDPKTYRKRSAGGHVHLGLAGTKIYDQNSVEEIRHRLVPYLDVFVGNTCTLLDRDPGAAERRENYGRAGEYRLPDHGVEYRTTSNFWLRSYSLMNLVFGLAHVAVASLEDTLKGGTLEDELMEVVDFPRVIQAIDTSNWDLAKANFLDIRPYLVKHLPKAGEWGLTPDTIDKFLMLAEAVKTEGLEKFFPDDPVTHWSKKVYVPFRDYLGAL